MLKCSSLRIAAQRFLTADCIKSVILFAKINSHYLLNFLAQVLLFHFSSAVSLSKMALLKLTVDT